VALPASIRFASASRPAPIVRSSIATAFRPGGYSPWVHSPAPPSFREIIAIPDIRTHCSTLAALLAAQDEERQFERIGAQSP
jgi:hypothetical protein